MRINIVILLSTVISVWTKSHKIPHNDSSSSELKFEDDPCAYDPIEQPVIIDRQGKRVSEIQCEYNMWLYKNHVLNAEQKQNQCLQRKGITSTVGSGTRAEHSEFPHMGAMGWKKLDGDYIFLCSSSLISTKFAITATHCRMISDTDKIFTDLDSVHPEIVRFGSACTSEQHRLSSHDFVEDVPIETIIFLEAFKFSRTYNDVALIRLAREVRVQRNITPACLWYGHLKGHTESNITGWGQFSRKLVSAATNSCLQYGTVSFIDRDECTRLISGFTSRFLPSIMDHQFCTVTMSVREDICEGNSGSPVQISLPFPNHNAESVNMHHIVGVFSFGFRCGWPNVPSISVNVSDPNILCWIENTVWPDEPNQFCQDELFHGYESPW